MKRLRRYFFAGLVIVLPIVATIWLLNFMFDLMTGWSTSIAKHYDIEFVWYHRFAAQAVVLILMIFVITLLGAFATRAIGSRITVLFQRSLEKIPLFNRVYGVTKQVINAFAMLNTKNSEFKRVALIEYPKQGIYTMAFVTNETGKTLSGYARHFEDTSTDDKFVNVFVPTTPNPTSGFFLVVPTRSVNMLDIPIEDAVKLIISGGAVTLDEVSLEKHNEETLQTK
jgi:uncharacterized membrane protein